MLAQLLQKEIDYIEASLGAAVGEAVGAAVGAAEDAEGPDEAGEVAGEAQHAAVADRAGAAAGGQQVVVRSASANQRGYLIVCSSARRASYWKRTCVRGSVSQAACLCRLASKASGFKAASAGRGVQDRGGGARTQFQILIRRSGYR